MTNDTTVFDGPGLPLLLELEQGGFDLAVRCGKLWVRPVNQLTSEQQAKIQQHRDELVTLVRICDAGVQERMAVYRGQLADHPGTAGPFIYKAGVPYTKAVCFSCAAALPEPRCGRCWRCSLAWRMAAGVPLPADSDGRRCWPP